MSAVLTAHDAVVGYHWSPSTRRAGIEERGLVIGAVPVINSVEGQEYRNPWVSVSPTPSQAWWLSAGAVAVGGMAPPESKLWLLWEVDISGLAATSDGVLYREWRVLQDIESQRVKLVGQRTFGGDV